MANWALVENDEVTGVYDLLPKSWKHISGLRLAADDLDFLKSLGWYPVKPEHDNYDKSTHLLDGYEYSLNEEYVSETLRLLERDPIPVIEFSVLKSTFMKQLREERNSRLSACDWTQLFDAQETFDDNTKQKWRMYRQKLRDIPALYEDTPIVNLFSVVWPGI
jgi:hypothetical protein